MSFCLQDISEFSVIPKQLKAKAIRLYLVEWFICGTLKLWKCGNFGICSKNDPPRATLYALDKAYLATIKCIVVNKAFKQVAEEHTKI